MGIIFTIVAVIALLYISWVGSNRINQSYKYAKKEHWKGYWRNMFVLDIAETAGFSGLCFTLLYFIWG